LKKFTELSAKIERFDSFWGAPEDIEKGFDRLQSFYNKNYLKYLQTDHNSRILVISCGPGYFLNMLKNNGYTNVLGIDSDPEKIKYAESKNLNCLCEEAFLFLEKNKTNYDLIIGEQEINHLSKDEILIFLELCWNNLKKNGTLIINSINGANPFTGAESLAQNFDHFNTFTEYSLKQVLNYTNFKEITIIPLNLYVFYKNPLNYIAIFWDFINTWIFSLNFMLYGKSNRIFTKKIAAVCRKWIIE